MTQAFMDGLDLVKEEGKGKAFLVETTIWTSTPRWGGHR